MNSASHIVSIMGVPFNDLTMDEAVKEALSIINNPKEKPAYIATINVDFLVNCLGWFPRSLPNHELITFLRSHTHLNVADGMPIVWLSKWLGFPLKQRIAGADLIPQLLKECQKSKLSIFILGGEGKVIQKAVDKIHLQYPDIHIAGILSPKITIAGGDLLHAKENDNALIEHINGTRPDILFLALGNPKQEIWFNRNSHQLKVPLSIGVGGTFNFIAGEVKRAPKSLQNLGLEWIYRFYQEPKRLWKRYVADGFQFLTMLIPLIVYNTWDRLFFKKSFTEKIEFSEYTIIRLPQHITFNDIPASFTKKNTYFDFINTEYLDIDALGSLLLLIENNPDIHVLNIQSSLRHFLEVHKVWDIFVKKSGEHLPKLDVPIFSISNLIVLTINVLGPLNHNQNYDSFLTNLLPQLNNETCRCNLAYCTDLDNAGIEFLLTLQHMLKDKHKTFKVIGLNTELLQTLQLAKVDKILA